MRKIMNWVMAATLFLGGMTTAEAQTLRGTVTDAISGEALIGATVKVVEADKGTISDADGNFRIDIPQSGRYTIETTYIGYEPNVMKEVLVAGVKEVVVDIQLRENKSELAEVVVKPRVNKASTVNPTALIGGVMLSMEEASRYAGGYNDPARLVTAYPGISGAANSSAISVHGHAPTTMQYRLEGVQIFTPNHFNDLWEAGFGMVSALNSNVIGNSDFFTSTFNANYSNTLSGVFDVKMRTGNNEKHEKIIQLGTVSEEFIAEGPLSKQHNSSYLFNVRYGFTSLASHLGLMDSYNCDIYFNDFSLKLNFPTKKAGTFSLFALGYYSGSLDQRKDIADIKSIYNAIVLDDDLYALVAGASHRIHLPGNWTWRTTLAYNGEHARTKQGYYALKHSADNVLIVPLQWEEPAKLVPYGQEKLHEDRLLLNTELSKQVTPAWLMQVGADYSHRFFRLNCSATDYVYSVNPFTTFVDARGNTGLGSAYWQNILKLGNQLTVNLGVAASYFLFAKDFSLEPRVSMKWDIDDRNTLSLGYGLHSMVERMDAYFFEQNGVRTNKNLGLSKAHNVLATYMHKFNDNLNLRLSTYFDYGFDTPVGINGSTFCAVNRHYNYFNEPMVNEGNTRNYGIDVGLEHYMSRGFYGQINGSLFQSEYRGQDKVWHPQFYNRRYMFKILAGKEWMVGSKKQNVFNLSVKYSIQGGLRYTPIDTDAMNRLLDLGEMPEEPIVKANESMSGQFRPDNIVDLTVSYKWNKRRVSHTIAFEGLNILGVETCLFQRYDLAERRAIDHKEGISLPNFFYRLDF